MKFIKKQPILIIVDVSASTAAFVGTVPHRRGEQVVVAVGELVRPLVSVHRLVLLLPDTYPGSSTR